MRYLFRIVVIVTSLLFAAMAVCAGEGSQGPGTDQALECSALPAAVQAPVALSWPDGSPCAGRSRTERFAALPGGLVAACDPEWKTGALWQNDALDEVPGDAAEARCATLCQDPAAPGDPERCSALCRDPLDPARCDPARTALRWRLPEVSELESLLLSVNEHACTIDGCRMDPVFDGPCDAYWAAGLRAGDDPDAPGRAFTDMRGGGVGQDPLVRRHPVRCVADRP